MTRLISWIKANKLASILLLIVLYFVSKHVLWRGSMYTASWTQQDGAGAMMMGSPISARPGAMNKMMFEPAMQVTDSYIPPIAESTSPVATQNRMISRDASLSLLVQNVKETMDQIVKKAQNMGGFLVSSDMSNPSENASGTVVVRVPSTQLEEVLTAYRMLGVRVVSEQMNGLDITDQFTDVQARLRPLRQTYAELDELRLKSTKIEEKMNILLQLQNLQSQIDILVGQEKYLKDTAQYSRVSVYVSTDEYELPYAPNDNWRAKAVFKQAVRDMVISLRGFATKGIYIMVYALIWIPLLIIAYLILKRLTRK